MAALERRLKKTMRKPLLARAAAASPTRPIDDPSKPISPALLILLLVLCAAPAAAQPLETVEVDANALVGIWKVAFPSFGAITLPGGRKWGPLTAHYCRIEQGGDHFTANCFPAPIPDGTVSAEKGHFHMAWGNMLARLYLDGNMTSAETFDGHNGLKVTGLAVENPALSHGEKLRLSPTMPDDGGKTVLLSKLLENLAGGDASGIDKKSEWVRVPDGPNLKALGKVESILYLGASPKVLPPNSKETPQPEFFRVYDVEFQNGHRICGLHQTDDGAVDAFRCV